MIVDQIELEVLQVGTTAAHGIDKLCESLKKLNTRLTSKGLDKLRNELMGVNTCLHMIDPSAVATVVELANALEKLGSATGSKTNIAVTYKDLTKVRDGVEQAGKAASKAATKFSKFTASLGRIAFYRALRTIIKTITSAFKEGLQNAYFFSQGINGSLAQALDNISTKTQTLKNQLGAALGELLQTAMPLIITIVSWLTKLADVLSQIFAALGGRSSYLKATDSAKKYADAASAGAAATKEWKNQLMGFDEINKLTDASSSGGGGGSGTDYGSMFENAEISQRIKDVVAWVQEHMELIKAAATAIGIAIAAWEIADWVKALSAAHPILSKIVGGMLTIGGLALTIYGFWKAWTEGINWKNLLTMLGGIAVLCIGLNAIFGNIGLAIGLIIGGVALLVVGFKEWIATGELSTETMGAIVAGLLLVGGAISLLTGSWIPLVVAAVAGLAVVVVRYWNNILQGIATVVNGIIGFINKLISAFNAVNSFFGGVNNYVPLIGKVTWGQYAEGGFPDEGELFIAREAGAEMVGSINGRTAVANNDQIVAAVSEGVYNAVSSAMGGRNDNVSVKVYLDSREIKAGQQRLNRAMGV